MEWELTFGLGFMSGIIVSLTIIIVVLMREETCKDDMKLNVEPNNPVFVGLKRKERQMKDTKEIQKVELYEFENYYFTYGKVEDMQDDERRRIYCFDVKSHSYFAVDAVFGDGLSKYFVTEEECLEWFDENERRYRDAASRGSDADNNASTESVKAEEQLKEDGTAKNATHYQQAEIEPIEIMQMYMTQDEFYGFCLGNVIKYALRSRFKGSELKDIEKMKQYAEWAVLVKQGKKINPKRLVIKEEGD